MYKRLNGIPPQRDEIKSLAKELNLKSNQIYKWFWDTKKKVEEDTILARQMGKNPGLVDNEEYARQMRRERECIGVDGRDGSGKRLTPQQIKTALKIN